MRLTSPALRWTVVVALAVTAVTTVLSVLLMPDFSGDQTDWLASIAASPGAAAASAHLFTFSQVFLTVGVVGVAAQIWARAPRLTCLAVAVTVLGAFGHAVYGGATALMLTMADDLDNADIYAALLQRSESATGLLPYMALGLLGTIVGLILLGAALLRAGYGPRWLGITLIAFVVVEFGLSGLSMWAMYLSGALFLVAFIALAVLTARGSGGEVRRRAAAPSVSEVGVV